MALYRLYAENGKYKAVNIGTNVTNEGDILTVNFVLSDFATNTLIINGLNDLGFYTTPHLISDFEDKSGVTWNYNKLNRWIQQTKTGQFAEMIVTLIAGNISVDPYGNFTSDNLQQALQQLSDAISGGGIGLTSVAHDITLNGDGTVSTPLGIKYSTSAENLLQTDATGVLLSKQVILDSLQFGLSANGTQVSVEVIGSNTGSFTFVLANGTNAGLSIENFTTAFKTKLENLDTELGNKQDISEKNNANGYAGLDGDEKIFQLNSRPSNVSYNGVNVVFTWADGSQQTIDVSEIILSESSDPSSLPTTGQKMFIRQDNGAYWTNLGGNWSGGFIGVTGAEKTAFNNKQNALISGTNIKSVENQSVLGAGNLEVFQRNINRFFTDFLNIATTSSPPWVGSAITGGTFTQNNTNVNANTKGVGRITSTATANTGYQFQTDLTGIRISGGEIFRERINPLTFTGLLFRAGFQDCVGVTDAVDGIYVELNNSGNLVLKTANNNTRTTSTTISTLAINTWYTIEIVVNANATSVICNLYNDSGVLITSSAPITTNIPTTAGREVGSGFICLKTTATATALMDVDLLEMKYNTQR